MHDSAPYPAVAALSAPETGFQAMCREAGPAMTARVPVDTPLAPVVAQAMALLDDVADAGRQHECRDGSWSSVWLARPPRSAAAPGGEPTPLLDRLPALERLFAELGGPVGLVLIARMAPGDLLDWHYDPASLDHAWSRLHLPLRTHPQAVTDFCHERAHWPVGGLYYGDYGFPHRVLNTAGVERLHLYFDVSSQALAGRLPAHLQDADGSRRQLREAAVNEWLAERSRQAL